MAKLAEDNKDTPDVWDVSPKKDIRSKVLSK